MKSGAEGADNFFTIENGPFSPQPNARQMMIPHHADSKNPIFLPNIGFGPPPGVNLGRILGARQLSPFGGGGPSQGALSTPPPPPVESNLCRIDKVHVSQSLLPHIFEAYLASFRRVSRNFWGDYDRTMQG